MGRSVESRGVQVEAKATWRRASISALVQTAVMMANRIEEVCRIGICVAVGFSNEVIPHGAELGLQVRVCIECVKFRKCDRSHDFDGKVVDAIGVTVTVA